MTHLEVPEVSVTLDLKEWMTIVAVVQSARIIAERGFELSKERHYLDMINTSKKLNNELSAASPEMKSVLVLVMSSLESAKNKL